MTPPRCLEKPRQFIIIIANVTARIGATNAEFLPTAA